MPSTNVVVITRCVRELADGRGKMTRSFCVKFFAMRSMLSASRAKSSSCVEQLFDLVVVRVEPLHGHEPLHDRHDAADGDEIEPHDLVDVVVLHLHRDARAVVRLRLVDLAERRARDAASRSKRAKSSSTLPPSSLSMRSAISSNGRGGT